MKLACLCSQEFQGVLKEILELSPEYSVMFFEKNEQFEEFLKNQNNQNDKKIEGVLIQVDNGLTGALRLLLKAKATIFLQQKWFFISSFSLQESSAIVAAFNYGLEDFFCLQTQEIAEIHARLFSKLKRHEQEKEGAQKIILGDVILNLKSYKAYKKIGNSSEEIKDLGLTLIEQKILAILGKRPDQVFTRKQLIELIWENTYVLDRTIDAHMAHLRHKLKETSVII